MLHRILIVLVSYSVTFCSADVTKMESAKTAYKNQDDDAEEEITAIPPTVISGAHLVCQPETKDVYGQTIDISCHFEKDGKVLKNIKIEESDFKIHDEKGKDLILGSNIKADGSIVLKVSLETDADIRISLESIGGEPLAGLEDLNLEVLSDVIEREEIEQTKDASDSNQIVAESIFAKVEIDEGLAQSDAALDDITFKINAGEAYSTSQVVTLSIAALGADEMYITNDAECSGGGVWEPYAETKTWILEQVNAAAKVYAKFRTESGSQSACVSSSIIHDDIGPSELSFVIDSGNEYVASSTVTLSFAANDAHEMYVTNTAGCMEDGSWEDYIATKPWTLAQSSSTASVFVKFRDFAGNESLCLEDSISYDDSGPSAASLTINGGNTHVNTSSVTLNLAATDAHQMYVTNASGCLEGGTWEDYQTAKTWTLEQTNTMAMVYVKFRDLAGNEGSCLSDSIIHDNSFPTGESLTIDGGNEYATSSTVTLSLNASGADEMYISNSATCLGGGNWEPYSPTKSWTLGQTNASSVVYAKFRDFAGNETSCVNDSIIHDSSGPSGASLLIDGGNTYVSTTSVSLSLAATDANQMYLTNSSGCSSGGTWQNFDTTKSWTLAQSNDVARVYVKFRDVAGNESSCLEDSIIHDNLPPSVTSFAIEGGNDYVNTSSVSLLLAVAGAHEMYLTNTATCSGGGSWQSYSTSEAWTLAQTNATATVYAKFRDQAGNESSCISDSITHDSTAPSGESVSIESGDNHVTSASVSLSLAATDADEMYVTNSAACAGGGSWETYATSNRPF